MSLCRFDFGVATAGGSPVGVIRSHVEKAGGSFEGSDESGTFFLPTPLGEFRGRYLVSPTSITIEVDEKPFFVPCSAIEARLSEYVEKSV